MKTVVLLVLGTHLLCASPVFADEETESLRIARPVPQVFTGTRSRQDAGAPRDAVTAGGGSDCCAEHGSFESKSGALSGSCAMPANPGLHERMVLPGTGTGVAPVLPQVAQTKNGSCCGVESEFFAISLMGPSAHFGYWLRQNLFPTLCHSVLCRRQCALSMYEPCNTLGNQRGLLRDALERDNGCNSGGCCEGSAEPRGDGSVTPPTVSHCRSTK